MWRSCAQKLIVVTRQHYDFNFFWFHLGSWPLFLETSFPAIKDNTDDMSLVNVFIYMLLHVFTFPIGRILSFSGQQHLAAGG
jgi:hypothetical protein